MERELNYNYTVVKQFSVMTVIWGIVGMLVGVIIDPAVFNLKYWMVPPYRDDGNHRYEKTDTGSPV